jgi:hypothetical protein
LLERCLETAPMGSPVVVHCRFAHAPFHSFIFSILFCGRFVSWFVFLTHNTLVFLFQCGRGSIWRLHLLAHHAPPHARMASSASIRVPTPLPFSSRISHLFIRTESPSVNFLPICMSWCCDCGASGLGWFRTVYSTHSCTRYCPSWPSAWRTCSDIPLRQDRRPYERDGVLGGLLWLLVRVDAVAVTRYCRWWWWWWSEHCCCCCCCC